MLLLWNHLDSWNQTAQEWSLEGPLQLKYYLSQTVQMFKMATTAIHRLTLDPMGKMIQKASSLKPLGQLKPNCPGMIIGRSSTTTNMIKAKLYMNVHWMVLYKLYVFCSDMKFKMAATAGLSLTLDPMGKMFQNASSLKPLGQLKPNSPGMIIGRSSTNLCFLCRSEIQDGHHRNT